MNKKCAHNEERIFGSNACGMASPLEEYAATEVIE